MVGMIVLLLASELAMAQTLGSPPSGSPPLGSGSGSGTLGDAPSGSGTLGSTGGGPTLGATLNGGAPSPARPTTSPRGGGPSGIPLSELDDSLDPPVAPGEVACLIFPRPIACLWR
jgi:hypothetical protein